MTYENREEAGEVLARSLRKLKLNPKISVVVAIPRGGVVVGAVIAKALKIRLLALVVKKIGAQGDLELAIGATTSFAKPILDRWLIRDLGIGSDYVGKESIAMREEAKKREKFLRIKIKESDFKSKNVIVCDDGLATGQTAKAAGIVIRKYKPQKLILAVGCAAPSTIEMVKGYFDEIICQIVDPDFVAVGQFYRNFGQVSEKEVRDILAAFRLADDNTKR